MRSWLTVLALVCLLSPTFVHGGIVPDIKENGQLSVGTEQGDSGLLDEGLKEHQQEQLPEQGDTSQEADLSVEESVSQKEESHTPDLVQAVHHEVLASPMMGDSLLQPQMSLSMNGGSLGSSQVVTECLFGTKLRCKGSNIVTTCDRIIDTNSPLYPYQCYYGDAEVTDYMTCCTPCCARSWGNDVHKWCSDISDEDFSCPMNDCSQLQQNGVDRSGAYLIQPGPTPGAEMVWCDMDTAGGGWTVIQSRVDESVDFDRTWVEYEGSFGNPGANYWLGLKNIHLLTRQPSELYVSMEDFDYVMAYARYDRFSVGNTDSNYILTLSGYSGNAGDSMRPNDSKRDQNGMMFSTSDRRNSIGSSCVAGSGGPWWHNSCGRAALNGKYYKRGSHTKTGGHGIQWDTFLGGHDDSMKSSKMMIRPVK